MKKMPRPLTACFLFSLVAFCSFGPSAHAVPVTFDIVVEGVAGTSPTLPFGMTEFPTGVVGHVVVDLVGTGIETVSTHHGTITEFSLTFGPTSFDLGNSGGSLVFRDGVWADWYPSISGIQGHYANADDTERHYLNLGNSFIYGADKLHLQEQLIEMVGGVPHGTIHWVSMDVALVESASSPVPEPSTWILLGSGLVGLGAWRRRSGK